MAALRKSQTAFLALQIGGGHIGMVVILASSLLSFRVRRDPTFLNFCITWIVSSVVFSILSVILCYGLFMGSAILLLHSRVYRGTEGNTIANRLGNVSPAQCAMQAPLTEGAQVMTAGSTLAVVIKV